MEALELPLRYLVYLRHIAVAEVGVVLEERLALVGQVVEETDQIVLRWLQMALQIQAVVGVAVDTQPPITATVATAAPVS
jgi:Mlc titration factor MtfA (ptsG expression regulator)